MDDVSGAVSGLFHAGITVSNMDVALAFYRDGLGLVLASDAMTGSEFTERVWGMKTGPVRVVFLRIPDSRSFLELFEFREIERHSASARPCDHGAGHVCLYVTDLDALYARLLEAGHSARGGEVVTIGVGPHAGAKVVYMKDPDGYHVELYERP
jgi:catechol 2,3-dioxygenase-like lactoylglutathione lyase family enzyme